MVWRKERRPDSGKRPILLVANYSFKDSTFNLPLLFADLFSATIMSVVSLKKKQVLPFSFKKKTCKFYPISHQIQYHFAVLGYDRSLRRTTNPPSCRWHSTPPPAVHFVPEKLLEVRHISQHWTMPKQQRSVLKNWCIILASKNWEVFLKGLVFFFYSHNFSNWTRFQVQVRPHLEILCLLCAVVRHLVDGRYGSIFPQKRNTTAVKPPQKKHRCTLQKTK